MIWTKLKGYKDAILGASWYDPFRVGRWGGATGGGDYLSPISFTATPKGANQAHITGISPTITNVTQFRYVRAYNADNSLAGEWWPSRLTPFLWNPTTSYLSVKGADWGSCAYLVIELNAEHRAYAPTEDAYQGYSVNPEHAWTQQDTLVDVTNQNPDATVYYYIDLDMYKYGGLQIDLDCDAGTVTATIEGSYQDDGTAQAACNYDDVTFALTGAVSLISAAAPANAMWIIDTPQSFKYLRLAVIYATGATTGDATAYWRGTY